MTDFSFPVLLMMMFLDILFIIKPKVPLLNLFFSLFTVIFSVYQHETLPIQPWFFYMMMFISLITMTVGLVSYFQKGQVKR